MNNGSTLFVSMLWPDLKDRSLWTALAASALAHALVLATLTGAFRNAPALAPAAVAKPIPIQVELVRSPAPAMAPEAEVLPAGPPAPAEPPPEAREKAAAHPSPVAAPRHEREDPNGPDPQPSIAVGQLADPIAAGATYALDLALRYPIAAAREPRLRGSLVVAYPPEALMAKKGKRVVALLTLDESGTVLETKLVPGDAVFGPAVLSALKDVQFTPADIDGRPAPYWVLLEFSFSADAAESGAMPQRPSKLRQPSVGR